MLIFMMLMVALPAFILGFAFGFGRPKSAAARTIERVNDLLERKTRW